MLHPVAMLGFVFFGSIIYYYISYETVFSIFAVKSTPPFLIQGPLAGVSCAPFRVLAEAWGQPAFCVTEMLSAHHLVHASKVARRFSFKDPREGEVCFQLSGTDPNDLARAIEQVIEWGANSIDLNCGCPVAKIRKKGAGSKLLEDPHRLAILVKAMKAVSRVPISIKIRVDDEMARYSVEAARVAQEAGADRITVHGRHWADSYDTPCRQDQIAEIVAALTIPVIANGDAKDAESVKRLFEHTGCAGVMISRAGVGQPWIFAKIRAELAGEIYVPPSLATISDLFLQHVRGLIDLEGEPIAVLQSRKLIKYYARTLANRSVLLEQVNRVKDYARLESLTHEYFNARMPPHFCWSRQEENKL